MKTSEITHICPYTGLRSFTEEESLYFKGRDFQVDQITALLEQNKFLMVTGASGEGKSSLIYAGLIPNARAGFFKAKYTNWVVADFRPERNPLTNMAKAIADKFESNPATVETELKRGFSSLIDLYSNSDFYVDEEDDHWKSLTESVRKEKKRKAANLMILVDQFEEFFTNPENFYNEALSQDSQIVVNLILETARIAIKRNLPVYIVCTMRSDYIGQCSAFRGLPEYIGFSQFFVPRLKRKDLKQVIEEPAILSGNRISQRLIERLVYDIAEGVDQLPILQHALSQVWLAADRGQEEMDLIHYAKVGGMPYYELPDEDQPRFRQWFNNLPEHQQKFYKETGLGKIIEIHASILYETAWEYYNKKYPDKLLSQHDAKRIIVNTFCCLTKIDNSRAVRNRMSLREITEIINTPEFNADVVGGVINIFREEGNSFVRPFITDDTSTHQLKPDSVLDITHESLIRNWNKLNKWASREFEFYSTYIDFKKQLDRWKSSGKSNDFLLPIGPLTYFENWYNTCKPNAGWIKRYSEIQEDNVQAERQAQEVLNDVRDFLKRSARKVMVTRAFMKYGPQRIGTALAIFIMLVLSGFYWYDAEQKTNDRVIERIRNEAFQLMKSAEVDNRTKAAHLLIEERYANGSMIPYLSSLEYKSRVSIAIETYKLLQYFDKDLEGDVKTSLLELIGNSLKSPEPSGSLDFLVSETNKFLFILFRDNYYNSHRAKEQLINELVSINKNLVLQFYQNKSLYNPTIPSELNVALQLWLTTGKADQESIYELIKAISPLAGESAAEMFKVYYPKGSFEPNGRQPSDFNNGYHSLASLYAAAGDTEGMVWCFNQLLATNQRHYFELARVFNNYLNLLGYLYQYNYRDKVPLIVNWVKQNTVDNPPVTVYRNAMIRAGYISHLYVGANMEVNSFRSYRGYFYPNLFFSDQKVFDAIVDDYESVLKGIKDSDERSFQLAMNSKRKAVYAHKYWFDRKLPIDQAKLDGWLKDAVDNFRKVSPEYLDGKVSSTIVYFGDGVRTSNVSRREQFLYPDYKDGWFSAAYHTDLVFNYFEKNNLLKTLYKTGSDLQTVHAWIARAFFNRPFPPPGTLENDFKIDDDVLKKIILFVDQHPNGSEFDKNLLYLILANNAFEKDEDGLLYFKKFDQQNIARSSDRYEYVEKTFFLNMMNQLCVNLASIGKMEEAKALAEKFTKEEERAFTYVFMADRVFSNHADPEAFLYLDSAFAKSERVNFTSIIGTLDSRFNLILTLSRIGSDRINNKAIEILRDIPENAKYNAILARAWGIANEGNFYLARAAIPATLTETQDLECRTWILLEANKKAEQLRGDNRWSAMDKWMDWGWYYVNYLPN